ncbi:MAG: hypothetical protein FWD45_00230 [Coriobacteriia bacterium]|nr:hypothetical protein [Coriobacteriia bacterium]
MARIDALSVFQSGTSTKYKLAELYGEVIDNVQKNTISSLLKNTRLSGDFAAGTVEASRIENSASKAYGSARSAGNAEKAKILPVPIPIGIHREMLKEFERSDIDRIGIVNLMQREMTNMQLGMERELETAFFAKAIAAGTAVAPAGDALERIDATILQLETLKNKFIEGVPRAMINVICNPYIYQEIRSDLDDKPNVNVDTTIEEFSRRHGVNYFSSVYMPAGIDIIVMATESVALPVKLYQYDAEGTIPLSNAVAEGFFYDYGCEAVMPDMIFYAETVEEEEG